MLIKLAIIYTNKFTIKKKQFILYKMDNVNAFPLSWLIVFFIYMTMFHLNGCFFTECNFYSSYINLLFFSPSMFLEYFNFQKVSQTLV